MLLAFAGVLLFGAPYLPTLKPQVVTALDLVNLNKEQTLLELGCGDGKVLVAAAERGLLVVGYELNPILAFISWARTRKYRGRVQVIWGDFWQADWPEADGIFVFLLDKYMDKLDKKIVQTYTNRKVKLVSFAFKIPGKTIGKAQKGIWLYQY